jgi:hypothetical protein
MGMRGVGFLLMGLCWLPLWTWADSSDCTSSGCPTSVSVNFKIVIPPRPLTTTQLANFSNLTTNTSTEAESGARRLNEQRNQITGLDGVIYVPANDGINMTYTVTKP